MYPDRVKVLMRDVRRMVTLMKCRCGRINLEREIGVFIGAVLRVLHNCDLYFYARFMFMNNVLRSSLFKDFSVRRFVLSRGSWPEGVTSWGHKLVECGTGPSML